jgi:hypothetical protein
MFVRSGPPYCGQSAARQAVAINAQAHSIQETLDIVSLLKNAEIINVLSTRADPNRRFRPDMLLNAKLPGGIAMVFGRAAKTAPAS